MRKPSGTWSSLQSCNCTCGLHFRKRFAEHYGVLAWSAAFVPFNRENLDLLMLFRSSRTVAHSLPNAGARSETESGKMAIMFSTLGIFTITFLDSRCGLVGNVIVESIMGIGAAPRLSAAALIRMLGIVAREFRQQPRFDATAFAAGWFRLASRASFAIASLLSVFSYSLGGVREALQAPAAAVERVWSEISVLGRQLTEGSPPSLGSVSFPPYGGAAFGVRECYLR